MIKIRKTYSMGYTNHEHPLRIDFDFITSDKRNFPEFVAQILSMNYDVRPVYTVTFRRNPDFIPTDGSSQELLGRLEVVENLGNHCIMKEIYEEIC